MPTNVPPQYKEAEQRFRTARSTEEKLACLREMYALLPKHKGTEKLQADIKTRMSKLQETSDRQKKKRGFDPYHVAKGEAHQIVLAGAPNSGKSSFVAATTHATPEIADFPFTTQLPLVAMMPVLDLQFELVDTPPVPEGGMPPWFPNLIRQADAVLLLCDLSRDEGPFETQSIVDQLQAARVHLDPVTHELREDGSCSRRTLLVATKSDAAGAAQRLEDARTLLGDRFRFFVVSAARGEGLDAIGLALFEALDIMRVYTKQPGHAADHSRPYVMLRGTRVRDLAERIHKDLAATLRYARVWGPSASFDGQEVHGDHILSDGDVVEIHAT
jgi:ribosome-interacting GTPase 1